MIFKRKEKINMKFESQIIENYLSDIIPIFRETSAFLAGGAIRSIIMREEPKDWDIFFSDKKDYQECVGKATIGFGTPINTAFSSTITKQSVDSFNYGQNIFTSEKTDIQLVNIFFKELKQTILSFDFTCCMAAYDFKTREFYFDPSFFPDNTRKCLVYNPLSVNPISSFMRRNKYIKKGYSITVEEDLKMIMKICELNIQTWGDLKKQLVGFPLSYDIKKELKSTIDEEKFSYEKLLHILTPE